MEEEVSKVNFGKNELNKLIESLGKKRVLTDKKIQKARLVISELNEEKLNLKKEVKRINADISKFEGIIFEKMKSISKLESKA